jgi:hypothetical protein
MTHPMRGPNRFKLGLFSINSDGGGPRRAHRCSGGKGRRAPAGSLLSTRAGLERALMEQLGLRVAALGIVEDGEAVHDLKRVVMFLAEHPL